MHGLSRAAIPFLKLVLQSGRQNLRWPTKRRKLRHKYGSRELIQTLNEHGITASYDEVLRFRKSAAKFVSNNQQEQEYHKMLGLTTEVGPVFS